MPMTTSFNLQNPPEGASTRKDYIDTARGIGLVLLVLGHIVKGDSFLFNWIFSFHMPLFYFLSGMCAREKQLENFPAYLKKRLRKRLLPYFIIVMAGFFICMIIPSYREVVLADGARLQLLHTFLLMTPRNLYIGQVWFLASLFWAEIYFYLWFRLFGKKSLLIQMVSVLCFIPIVCNLWRIHPLIPITGRVPFQMDTAFMGAFCYILGFQATRYCLLEKLQKKGWLLILPLLLCNIYFGTWKNGYVNMVDLVYKNMPYFLIAMLSGISTVVLLAFYLPRLPLLTWCGKYSLPLFASHTLLIYLVREVIHLFTGRYYTMMGDVPTVLAFVMTAVIILLFLPIGMLYDMICKKIPRFWK